MRNLWIPLIRKPGTASFVFIVLVTLDVSLAAAPGVSALRACPGGFSRVMDTAQMVSLL